MVFNDVYPEGHQGGVTLVLNDERKAASGDVRFEASQGQWQGFPKVLRRIVDEANNEISVTLCYPDTSKHMAGFKSCHLPGLRFQLYNPGKRRRRSSCFDRGFGQAGT